MSELKVEVLLADSWEKHPNADRLALLVIKGWNVVTQLAGIEERMQKPFLYFPVDSVLPEKLESLLFPPDSKITLSKSRIKSIRIRGAISQGMVVPIDQEMIEFCPQLANAKLGDDVTELLGVVKYEPPSAPEQMPGGYGKSQQTRKNNPHFNKYVDIQHLKNYPNLYKEGDLVDITEKMHGTSARYAMLPTVLPVMRWKALFKSQNRFEFKMNFKYTMSALFECVTKRVLQPLGLLSKFEFCYGSRNVQLQNQFFKQTWYPTDVYGKIAKELNIKDKLKPNEALYGEIVGWGIQKGYQYGCVEGQHDFYAYDVQRDGKWLDPANFRDWCKERGVKAVPHLYTGTFSSDLIDELRTGDSTVGGQKVREGVVVKPIFDEVSYVGRKVLKCINDDYWLADNTDFQ